MISMGWILTDVLLPTSTSILKSPKFLANGMTSSPTFRPCSIQVRSGKPGINFSHKDVNNYLNQ